MQCALELVCKGLTAPEAPETGRDSKTWHLAAYLTGQYVKCSSLSPSPAHLPLHLKLRLIIFLKFWLKIYNVKFTVLSVWLRCAAITISHF